MWMPRDASTPPARRTPRRQERMYTYAEARVSSPLLERTSRLSFNLFGLCHGFTGQETSKLPKQQPRRPKRTKAARPNDGAVACYSSLRDDAVSLKTLRLFAFLSSSAPRPHRPKGQHTCAAGILHCSWTVWWGVLLKLRKMA